MSTPIQKAGTVLRYVAPILVIAVGVLAARALIAAKKAPPKVERPARVLPVEVAVVESFEAQPTFEAYGVVRPQGELSLRPIVGGPVVEVHPNMTVGGRVSKGDVLFRVDPRDFELNVATSNAALLSAKADLAIEEGQAAVAKSEWALLDGEVKATAAGKSLALREPYLERSRANVASAEAQLDQARLNLSRTAVVAPFDAVILSENLEVGAQVSAGGEVAVLVDTAAFLIEVTMPASRIQGLDFESGEAEVRLSGSDESEPRQGRLLRLAGEVDAAGRMARVQIAVPNPLSGAQPLLLGSYLAVDVPLKAIPGALSIPRAALREGDVVWLPKDGKELALQGVHVALRRDDDVLITDGLSAGDQVIVSSIAVPLPGTALRVIEMDPEVNGPNGAKAETTAGGANQ